MRTTDQRCLIFVFHLQLPHCAQEKGHSLLVLLAPAGANLQSPPSPPARTSHDRGRHMLSCAWFGPAACTAPPREPVPSFTWASALPCSLEKQLVPSMCVDKLSCISEALRLMSFVRCSAFFASTDCFVSRTAVAQWNSHARTVLDSVKIFTRNVSQTDPELDRLLVHGMPVPNREWDCGVVAW